MRSNQYLFTCRQAILKYIFSFILIVAEAALALSLCAQPAVLPDDNRQWNAHWIAAPDDPGTAYGVYYFRKNIELTAKPASFIIHLSADNRYKLYVNETLVSLGPARGDIYNWNYETVDIGPYLAAGRNAVAALVWNEAQYRPEAQLSTRTAFIVQGASPTEDVLNTDKSWKCIRDNGHQPMPGYFFAASTGEMVDMYKGVKKGWTTASYDDSAWPAAAKVLEGKRKGTAWGLDWALVPSILPPREMTDQRIPALRSAVGADVPSGFPLTKTPVTVAAHTTATLLLDQTFETNAYITLNFSGGRGAGISLGYAESLYERGSRGVRKGDRNEVDGKEFVGRKDSLIADGRAGASFTTLNFRTFRYIRLLVQTKEEPLVIDDIYGTFTGYPFKRTAVFTTDAPTDIPQMLDIGWRTARLNAWETYTDCPYYEQLQYIGDTRIQALISYYNSNDDRLARNALNQIDYSRLPEGITRSCYPTKGTQVISPFSLWYIGMLYDYWMYRGDDNFIRDKLMGERAILHFFSKYQQPDGSLKETPYWAFVDWAGNMWGGLKGADGSAAIYDLQLLWAYQWAIRMEDRIGLHDYAVLYSRKAAQLKTTIQRKYWDGAKKLYADTKEKNGYSQHANALAILTGVVPSADVPAVVDGLLRDTTLTQCSIYFKYYLHQALIKAGKGNDYMKWLDIWRNNIKMGLTTWAEYSDIETSRSDCHAWGASPNIEFFRTVLGIDSDAPGFAKIRIEPHLGDLKKVSGGIPHPAGKVAVDYRLDSNKWKIKISLPVKTSGVFVWQGKQYVLKGGEQVFVL